MVPYGLSKEQFLTKYRRQLERSSKVAIAEIRRITGLPVPAGVERAEVEVFIDEDGGAPAVWLYYVGKNNKVDNADLSIFPGRSMELPLQLDRLADFDERYFAESFDGTNLAANIVKAWVAECWWKAGAWSYAIPTELSVHDGIGDGSRIVLTESAAR